jgi:prepilin-type N-terminal cleavage/methylation domain-containing protein
MKRSFTLIEIVVALALFSLLATTLFGLYMGYVKISRAQVTETARIERLITLRVHLERSLCKAALQNKQHHFYVEDGALYFTFDNGVDPDPAYSSLIKGVLFQDNQDHFILEEYPLTDSGKRTYVLAEDVRNLSFECLPDKGLPFAVRIHLDEDEFAVRIKSNPSIIGFK